jgi:hypothetical protein
MLRRDFLSRIARIPLVLVAVPVVGACVEEEYPKRPPGGGGTGSGSDQPDPDTAFRVENDDDSGHQHWFEVACLELDDGKTTWTAQGAHTHQVTLTSEQLDAILQGDMVSVTTTGGHTHTWVFAMPQQLCG